LDSVPDALLDCAKLLQRDDQQQIGEPFDDHSQSISPKTVGAVSFR
jgi:hypothetical protein